MFDCNCIVEVLLIKPLNSPVRHAGTPPTRLYLGTREPSRLAGQGLQDTIQVSSNLEDLDILYVSFTSLEFYLSWIWVFHISCFVGQLTFYCNVLFTLIKRPKAQNAWFLSRFARVQVFALW